MDHTCVLSSKKELSMYVQSFMAHDPEGKLIAADSAQRHSGNHYTCHLCSSPLRLHREANPAWFEPVTTHLTDNGRQHCPYVHPDPEEIALISMLRTCVPEIWPVLYKGDWHCTACGNDYHGECYCLTCKTGSFSKTPIEQGLSDGKM